MALHQQHLLAVPSLSGMESHLHAPWHGLGTLNPRVWLPLKMLSPGWELQSPAPGLEKDNEVLGRVVSLC